MNDSPNIHLVNTTLHAMAPETGFRAWVLALQRIVLRKMPVYLFLVLINIPSVSNRNDKNQNDVIHDVG